MKEIISAVYKIVNEVTGDFYIGSSRNVKRRWAQHKYSSTWKQHPNNPMYKDMQTYGVDKFMFQILVPVMPENLKQVEQEFIEMLNPTYNNNNAKGWNTERHKESIRKYHQSEKGKEANKKYFQSEKGKETLKKYFQSEKYRKTKRKYHSQLCEYNGETLTLITLAMRFQRMKIPHPTLEAKKYLITTTQEQIEAK